MNLKPFSDMSYSSMADVYNKLTSYRTELRSGDNGAADHNKSNDVVDLRYDKTVLTAKLNGENYSVRNESPAGVVDNDYKQVDSPSGYNQFALTSVARTPDGIYSGERFSGYSSNNGLVKTEPLSTAESEFLFNLHDPALKPSS